VATPKRTLILNDLVTTMQSITVANGYNSTVAKVTRAPRAWTEVAPPDRPFIAVVAGPERPRELPGQYRVELDVLLHCLVEAATEEAKITAINNLRNDIRKAINVDQTRGANPDVAGDRNAVMTNIAAIEIEDIADQTQGHISMLLTCVYMEGRSE
jgi:hypothetical protein